MTELDFDRKYTLDDSIKSEVLTGDGTEGMFETYGNDIEQVIKIANTDPMRVWTMVDSDDGMYLIQGYHLVNRIYYVITKEQAESEFEEYLFESYEDDLEELG